MSYGNLSDVQGQNTEAFYIYFTNYIYNNVNLVASLYILFHPSMQRQQMCFKFKFYIVPELFIHVLHLTESCD